MRGGKRAGSGRKKLCDQVLKRYTFRIRPEADEILKKQKNKSKYINEAIIKYFEKT